MGFKQQPEQLHEFLDFIEEDKQNVRRVIEYCREENLDVEFQVHKKAESAEESADNTGMELNQIVKTLVFKAGESFIAVLCPGDKRVDEQKVQDLTGKDVRMAKPSEVKEQTGYVVGGVSPFNLDIPVYMEETLLQHKKVKPAAGSRVVGVKLSPEKLKKTTGAESLDLSH